MAISAAYAGTQLYADIYTSAQNLVATISPLLTSECLLTRSGS